MKLYLIKTEDGYKFYRGTDRHNNKKVYNIVPEHAEEPKSGYYDMAYLEKVKGVKF